MSKLYLPREEQFDLMNENLARIAGALGATIDTSNWAGIQRAVRSGVAPSLFPVGAQLVVNHGTYGDMVFDVVAHDYFKSTHDPNAHTMTIMSHVSIGKLQYDAPEAFYYAFDDLPAGTYNFTIKETYRLWEKGTYQFTLTQTLPCFGHLSISPNAETALTSCKVTSVVPASMGGVIETVSITEGNGGTNLGTFGEGLNHIKRVSEGSDNYAESAIRQFLNSSKPMNEAWAGYTKYDLAPSWWGTEDGFMLGLDEDFLSVVGEVIVPCATNSEYECPVSKYEKGTKYILKDKFYLASAREVMGDSSSYVDDGTSQFTYYVGSDSVDREKYQGGTPYAWWTRSPYKTLTANVQDVTAAGLLSAHYPRYNFGIAPVCTIV